MQKENKVKLSTTIEASERQTDPLNICAPVSVKALSSSDMSFTISDCRNRVYKVSTLELMRSLPAESIPPPRPNTPSAIQPPRSFVRPSSNAHEENRTHVNNYQFAGLIQPYLFHGFSCSPLLIPLFIVFVTGSIHPVPIGIGKQTY